ncbi:MAG: mechanosensitive ion channel domain-containing protein [Tepidisphaerales bacterium]
MDEAGKAVFAAEADLTQASNSLAQEEKASDFKKQYTGKSSSELAGELANLAEEGIGLKGTFELGLARFNAAAAEADRLRKAIEAIRQPDVKIPQLARPEDVEQAASSTQKLIDFYAQRSGAMEKLKAGLAEVIRLGTEFNADATVSSEHLFRMRVIAEVLKKSGDAGAAKIPEADPDRVLDAERRGLQQMAGVQAAVERAKADLPVIEKQLSETLANADAATGQLTRLKQSQAGTLAALAWESKLKGMTADRVVEAFNTAAKALQEMLVAVDKQQAEYKAALAATTDLVTKLDGLKDPLLRAAEEAGQAEKSKILGELRKEAGLERALPAPVPGAAGKAESAAKPVEDAERKPGPQEKKPEPTEMEKATASLQSFQQLVSGRLRVLEERDRVGKDLLAAIAAMEKVNGGYGKALADARQGAMQLHTTAIDLKKRVGRGEISSDKAPAELTQALRPELLAKLDSDAAALFTTESQFKQQKDAMQKPESAVDAGKALTKEMLGLVGQRLDLLADLRHLDAAYRITAKDRDPGETKRLEQEAAERQDGESGRFDALLAIDTSKRGKALAELLESDYRGLIELELKEDNLRQQREKAEKLAELAQKEQAFISQVLPVLEKQVVLLEAERDEEVVLAQARLKPEQADELLRAYRAKTGRLLPKPVPVGEKEKAEKVAAIANALFEKTVRVAGTRNWGSVLSARLDSTGITAEAGVYQDEESRINASSGADARRIEALTGQKPPEPGSKEAAGVTARQKFAATGGSIAMARQELAGVRSRGVVLIVAKLLAILIGAFLLPRLLRPLIHRAMGSSMKQGDEHGNTALMLRTLEVFAKTAIWITAIAIMLSVLGFDVTAIVAGLGIGGLAIGLAAQPVIADVISAVIIFAERKFSIGDVIKIGGDEPAKVVGLSWRGTQLKGPDGLVVNVPNRNITSASVRNLTKEGRTFDSLAITITTPKDVASILAVIKQAADECSHLTGESGHAVKEYQHKGSVRVIKYQLWWYLRDYDVRNKTRDEVFARISTSLSNENMAGTEVTLA